ncbi:MAG: hypothetical protein ABL930_06935 [Pseudobdellovibrio sp.]
MSLLSRKQFVERFVGILGVVLVPSVLLAQTEDSSKEVLLVRKIKDDTSVNFDHAAYYEQRRNFLDEQKFKNLTQIMINNKEILDLKFEHNATHVRIEIKFNSKKSYSKYCELTRSFVSVDIFKATNYSINDKIIRA